MQTYKPHLPDNIFTPFVRKNGTVFRYELYLHDATQRMPHGEDAEPVITTLGISPDGPWFLATVYSAPCGLGCYCGAYVKPLNKQGRAFLKLATTF